MTSIEQDYLMLSGIQHFQFCKRQWALIDIEACWKDNEGTTEGRLLHEKIDNPFLKESRANMFYSRAIPVTSSMLKLSGILDVVEFTKSSDGIPIKNKKGLWMPHIVEYKRGRQKKNDCDILQLAAEVICLEETLNISLQSASLYYFAIKKRILVSITDELRQSVKTAADTMHSLYRKKQTPPAKAGKHCKECSLYDICLPALAIKKYSVYDYIAHSLEADTLCENY